MSTTAYEVMLLTNAELEDTERAAVVERLSQAVVKGGGTVGELTEWGRRKLAYEIAKQREAFYTLAYVDCDGDTLDETVHLLRITDGVLRVMAVNRVDPLPEGVELAGITDEEAAAGPPRGGRGGRGGGRGRDRDR